jgi:hypothetical protein
MRQSPPGSLIWDSYESPQIDLFLKVYLKFSISKLNMQCCSTEILRVEKVVQLTKKFPVVLESECITIQSQLRQATGS